MHKENECLHHLYWYASSARSVPTPHTVQVWSIVYFRWGHAKCLSIDKRTSPHFLFYNNSSLEVRRTQIINYYEEAIVRTDSFFILV